MAQRIQTAYQAADGGTEHQIDRNFLLFKIVQHTDMGGTFRPASAQDQGHGRAVPPHPVQALHDGPGGCGIQLQAKVLLLGGQGAHQQEQPRNDGNEAFHVQSFSCSPASMPHAA